MLLSETTIPSQAGHWYDRVSGQPVYEMPCKSKDGMRPTTIRDARQCDLAPSVTLVLGAIAKPGLEAWKDKQLLEASLTLPKQKGETLDDYAKRVVEDAKAQSIAAAERGTQLHAAIEKHIQTKVFEVEEWHQPHVIKVMLTLRQYGINLFEGKPEHTFSAGINGLFYGGKVDLWFKNEPLICDFKSKQRIENGKRLAFDEHLLQLSAYGFGLFSIISSTKPHKWQPFRAINVFIGCDDCEVRVVEHEPADIERGFSMWMDILSFWYKKNQFGPFSKEK